MKNFLLGAMSVLLLGLFSFNSLEDILVVKPASPKIILTKTVSGSNIGETISKYVKQGYILHNVYYGGNYSNNTIVFYKY